MLVPSLISKTPVSVLFVSAVFKYAKELSVTTNVPKLPWVLTLALKVSPCTHTAATLTYQSAITVDSLISKIIVKFGDAITVILTVATLESTLPSFTL